ncbi:MULTISPECIES: hypothetical protein [unclassified Nostoc]|uniref:hypothetical protein n=1 Tax=unclassified Nostoc TaxID=2593658 RepID=UPI0016862821|nr:MULTISPECIES: hypothetical protein [unclassified Nostoc]MBD2467577.1 hypothetical protein [Nostoc sp. FACHB-145]
MDEDFTLNVTLLILGSDPVTEVKGVDINLVFGSSRNNVLYSLDRNNLIQTTSGSETGISRAIIPQHPLLQEPPQPFFLVTRPIRMSLLSSR